MYCFTCFFVIAFNDGLFGIRIISHRTKGRKEMTEDIDYRGYIIRKNRRDEYTEIWKGSQYVERIFGVSKGCVTSAKSKIDSLIKRYGE